MNKAIAILAALIATIGFFIVIGPAILYFAWNPTVTEIFGLPAINFKQAFALVFVFGTLFKGINVTSKD